MAFESFAEAHNWLLWSGFILAFILGAVVNKTNFCTMGAVSDMVNMGDYSRFRAWLLAIAVAIAGVVMLEFVGVIELSSTFPPYRGSSFIWLENLLGGIMFGIGMTLASGCGNKTLIRIGGGNLKSIVVFLIIGITAYYMLNPFPGSDKTLYSELFYGWMNPTAVSLTTASDLGSLVNSESAAQLRLIIGLVLVLAVLVYVFKSAEFRASFDNLLGGLTVGLVIVMAWYATSTLSFSIDDQPYSLAEYYSEWDFLAESSDGKPASSQGLNAQSFTFINPIGQAVGYFKDGLDNSLLSFGLLAVAGVILGSLFWSLISRSFRLEWFVNLRDFVNHAIGAVLMGLGGTLAMGCTIGQAVTGISTLAIGSFVAFLAILLGSALTMKVQYYKMLYEDASFLDALLTSLVELKMLPSSMRRLEAL